MGRGLLAREEFGRVGTEDGSQCTQLGNCQGAESSVQILHKIASFAVPSSLILKGSVCSQMKQVRAV